jgi:arylsulfatase
MGLIEYEPGTAFPGHAQLYVDGKLVAQTEFPVTTPVGYNPGGLTCGRNPGTPITPAYQAPFEFTGTLHHVTIDLSGDIITDSEAEIRMAMGRQ